METAQRKHRLAAAIVAALLCVASAAHAEDVPGWFPAGSLIVEPNGTTTTISHGFGVVSREDIDITNAEFELNRQLTADLITCNQNVLTLTKPPTGGGWLSAAKWVSLGVAIAGSFGLGIYFGVGI